VANWSAVARRIRVPMGFVFAAVYLWLAKPTIAFILSGSALVALGLTVRGSASGHVQKNEQLTTSGPYAHTRNPLYLGSLILAVGFAIAGHSWWIGVAVILMFVSIYLPVILAEEAFLRERFPAFEEYAQRVPRLLPRLHSFGNTPGQFSWGLYCKHREYNATVGSLAMLAALMAKALWFPR